MWLHLEEAQGRPVHLLSIQETHWTFTSEWQAHGYWLIHSSLGTKTRSAGILHLIHQRFANTHQIRTDHAVPGRLLYTRLATEPPSPSSASTNTAGPRTPAQLPLWIIEAREGVWTKLHHLLHNLPSRHQLLVLGDFNTQCVPPEDHPRLAGVAPRIDKATPLQKDYVPMLPKHPSRPLSSSRLDLRTSGQRSHLPGRHRAFILCREHQSDRCTRQAHVLKRAPFVPTAGNTDSNHAVARSPPAPSQARARPSLDGAHYPQSSGCGPRPAATLLEVRLQLNPVPSSTDPCAHINSQLQQAWQELAHAAKLLPTVAASPRMDLTQEITIKQLWLLKRQKQQQPTHTFMQAARALQLHRQIRHVQNVLHKRGKQSKQERVDRLLQDAEASNTQAALFHASRQLAPKTRQSRIQLRDSQGMIMSPSEELKAIQHHFRTIFGDRVSQIDPPEPRWGLAFTHEEDTSALTRGCLEL